MVIFQVSLGRLGLSGFRSRGPPTMGWGMYLGLALGRPIRAQRLAQLRLNQPVADRITRELDAVAHSQLLEDVGAVTLDRLETDHEHLGDLLVGVALGDELHHLLLTRTERVFTNGQILARAVKEVLDQ